MPLLAPLAPPLSSQIYICVTAPHPHPTPNSSSTSPAANPTLPGNSLGAACYRAISTQGRGCRGREQSAGKSGGREAGSGKDGKGEGQLPRVEGRVTGPRVLGQRAGPWDSPGCPAPSLANAKADGGLSWELSVLELLESQAPEPLILETGALVLAHLPGCPCEAGGSGECWSGEGSGPQARTPPAPVPPNPLAPRGARESPLHREGNQCSINVRLPGGGERFIKDALFPRPARGSLPSTGKMAAAPAEGGSRARGRGGTRGKWAPLSYRGRWEERPVRRKEGERKGEREGRRKGEERRGLGGRWRGGSQSERGGGEGMGGSREEGQERPTEEVAPREAGEQEGGRRGER